MVETIKSYNEYRKGLKADNVYATAQKIMEAVNLAERYALKECGDWMEAKMVERDMKEIKRDAAKMYEEAQKMKAIEKQLEMLYEEVGRRLERYFEIADQVNEAPQAFQTQAQPNSVSIASLG
jgi:predicted nuclease with TOPRIM domain